MIAHQDPGLAMVFDLDGTLIDSVGDIVGAANRLLAEEGRRPVPRDAGRHMVGEGAGPLLERAFAATGEALELDAMPDLLHRYRAHYERYPIEHTTVFPGVFEVLRALVDDGAVLGVCTNKPHGASLLVLEELGLAEFFAAVLGGDALKVRKPDAAHLNAVIEAMGATGLAAIHVGDSPTDVAVARNAGVPVIAVSHGYSRVPPAELGADALIDDFSELRPAIAAIRNRV